MSSVLPVSADRTNLQSSTLGASRTQASHRTDIDGLRGLAVLSVLAVHAFPQWLRGGFVGVDIFFVLSGYLISGILLQSMTTGRFDFATFYLRRVRRIFPALCIVLLACLVFSALWTFPGTARQIGAHVAAGAVFLSNVALWKEAGYFDMASEAKPLLHLWSLGVEEQFYLLWPLVIVMLARRRQWMLWTICALIVLSFGLNVAFVADKPTAVFFLLPARLWELMIGALLAYLSRYHGEPMHWFRDRLPPGSATLRRLPEAMAASGLAMLIAAMALVDRTEHFPGWWALLPTLGTFLLLAAGPRSWVARRILSHSVLRFYGLVSYPLYLWHWPLLSFPVVMGIPLTNETRVLILIASVALAALTYELVEKPIRSGSGGRRAVVVMCAALGGIGLAGLAMNRTDGLLQTYPPELRGLAASEFRFDYADYRIDRCMLRLGRAPEAFASDCIDRTDASRKLIFLWGDSHAAALYSGFAELVRADESGHRMAQYTAARCPPIVPAPLSANTQCERVNQFAIERIAEERPHTVVLAAHWARYPTSSAETIAQMESLRATVGHLRALGVLRVVVVGSMPTWTTPQPRVVLRQWAASRSVPERNREDVDPLSLVMDDIVARAIAGTDAAFVSPVATLCSAEGCLASIRRGGVIEPMAYDESHLSTAAASILVRRNREAFFH